MPDQGASALRLAMHEAHRYLRLHPQLVQREELISDAAYGAAKACVTFDPTLGVPFEFWVYRRVRGEIIDGIRRRAPLTKDQARAGLRPEDRPAQLDAVSLDEPAPGGTLRLSDLIPDQRRPLEQVETCETLRRILATLPPRLAAVLRAHDLDGVTLAEIGRRMGVTESRACQLRMKALKAARNVA